MSFSHSLIAVSGAGGTGAADADALREHFLEIWTEFRVVETSPVFATYDELFDWAAPRAESLQGESPEEVMAFCTDGAWSVLIDFSMLMVSDDDKLEALSERLGRVVAATTQGTAGFAQLLVFDQGRLVRSITRVDGNVETQGEPIPEERDLDLSSFYLDEIETLWQRFGMSSFLDEIAGPFVALHVEDATDYDTLFREATREMPVQIPNPLPDALKSRELPIAPMPAAPRKTQTLPVAGPAEKKLWWKFW